MHQQKREIKTDMEETNNKVVDVTTTSLLWLLAPSRLNTLTKSKRLTE